MPIYEYRCQACGAEFEKLQRTVDAPPPPCPKCASADVGRRVSLSSFQLKGTGWYSSDYKPATAPSKSADGGATTPTATPASGSVASDAGGSGG